MISNGLISIMQSGLLVFLGCSILLGTRSHYIDVARSSKGNLLSLPSLIHAIKTKIFEFP